MLLLGACSGGPDAQDGPAPRGLAALLPPVASLDGLGGKGPSALVDSPRDVGDVVAAQLSAGDSNGWVFQSGASHSWVLYRLPAPAGGAPPLAVRVLGSERLWMLVADYATNRWVRPQRLGQTLTQYDLTTLAGPVSPGDFVYVAFVLTESTGGLDDRIRMLSLRYDNETNPPVYYVTTTANGGDDTNPGTKAAPWATLQHAADNVMPGDSVVVLPGGYTGFHLQTGGMAGQPVTFAAQPGVRIVDKNENAENGNGNTADGINIENWDSPPISNVVIEGFEIDGDLFPGVASDPGNNNLRPRTGIRVVGGDGDNFSRNIVIRNNICRNCRMWGILTGFVSDIVIEGNECMGSRVEHGIYHSNSGDRATIRRNVIHNNNGNGIHMNGDINVGSGDGILSDCLVEGNVIYENGASGGSGINCDGVQASVIRNNLLFSNHAGGISLYQIDGGAPAIGNFITNNTILQASDGRWCVNIRDGSTGATLRNNILLSRHSFRGAITIDAASQGGFTSNFNVVIGRFTQDDGESVLDLEQWRIATGQDMNSLVSTPEALFYDPAGMLAEDYLLKPGAPAREAGGVQNAPNLDLRGAARPSGPKFDAGCYEMTP